MSDFSLGVSLGRLEATLEVGEQYHDELMALREENERLRQQNADMAAWINAQQGGV